MTAHCFGDPRAHAAALVARHGRDMAMQTAWAWQQTYGGQESEGARHWALVVTHLRVLEKHPGKPNTKAQRRRIRERLRHERAAKANDS